VGLDRERRRGSAAELLLDGDRFRMESPAATYDGRFNLDTSVKPMRIDIEFTNEVASTVARYDIHTKHAPLFGGEGQYTQTKIAELAGISAFVAAERRANA